LVFQFSPVAVAVFTLALPIAQPFSTVTDHFQPFPTVFDVKEYFLY